MPNKSLRLSLVWAVILAVSVLVIFLQRIRGGADPEGMTAVPDPASAAEATVEPLRMEAELLGKIVSAGHAWAPTMSSEVLLSNAEPLKSGNTSDQIAYAILLGTVDGWSAGADFARTIEIPQQTTDASAKAVSEASIARRETLRADVVAALEALDASNGDYTAVGDETRERIEADLGFFGRLLSADAASEASRALGVVFLAGAWYVGVFLLGLVGLLILAVLLVTGRMKPRLEPASDGHVMIVLGETFAIWMVLYLLLTIGAGFLAGLLPDAIASSGGLLLSIAAMAGSLIVLAYPRARGVSGADLRAAIGLHTGEGLFAEIGAGIFCYLSAVPILVVGGIIYFALTRLAQALFGTQEPPSHPAVEMLGGAGALDVVLLLILAAVMAPIVEEIAFRGFLYGHLRGAVAPRTRVLSALVSAIVSSVIFAAIHPQGLMFVPALGGLAVGFCLYREVRGSLVAPMVAHGINNAVTLTLGLMLFGA
ncbi:MAG: lysostaphin resistance A-like protein [bacterium]